MTPLVQVVDGEAAIALAGRPHRLRAGDVIIMPAHQQHAVKALARFKMLLTSERIRHRSPSLPGPARASKKAAAERLPGG
jgi:quercetin dioxygenase-like cupin family protein